jgi:hypothetical protein
LCPGRTGGRYQFMGGSFAYNRNVTQEMSRGLATGLLTLPFPFFFVFPSFTTCLTNRFAAGCDGGFILAHGGPSNMCAFSQIIRPTAAELG